MRPITRTGDTAMKNYTHYSACAPLAFVGTEVKRKRIWDVIEQKVHIPQKDAGHLPTDKLKDAWINILSGGKGVVEVNTRVKPDRGLQKAFGRQKCADQSTISRCLSACGAENVKEMRQALEVIIREHSRCCHHDYAEAHQWLDVDITGITAGRKAEGSTKGYFSHAAGARGRQVGRVLASRYNEIVVDQLFPGHVQLERSLQGLVLAAEAILELDEAKRAQTIIRVDGGGGRDEDINWLLEREYLVLVKVKNWQRSKKLLKRVKVWHCDEKDPNRRIGWIEPSHVYTKPTRQIGVEDTHADGKIYRYVLVSNLTDEMIYALNQFVPSTPVQPEKLLSLLLNLYDLRSGGVETSNRNSKSGLGLHKRNKKSFEAQEMLLLLAQLAYLVLSWFHRAYLLGDHRFAGYGWLRIVRDIFHIPGKLSFDEQNHLIAIALSRDHLLSSEIVSALHTSGGYDDLSLILRKI